jgi:hypothetical protein
MENIRFAEQFASGSSTGGIQEAINDLTNGGTVMLPAGTTIISATITVGESVKIVGHGWGETAVTSTQTSGDEFLVTVGGVILEDFAITRSTQGTSGAGVHFSCSCNELQLLRMRVNGQYNGVVTDSTTEYLFIDDSLIDGGKNDGIDISGGGTRLTKNRIYFNGATGMTVTGAAGMFSSLNEFFARWVSA